MIALIIPAYRPSETLLHLIVTLRSESPDLLIVVVDDGSGPVFAELFANVARVMGVIVVRNAVNLGKGAALKHGFNHALVAFPDLQFLVTADADGQHLPKDILAIAKAGCPELIVLGIRTFNAKVPLRSRLGNILSRNVYRAILGVNLVDTQTGLRCIPKSLAGACLSIRSNGYEFETEQIIAAQTAGLKFKELPIQTVYIDGNASSHFNPILDSFKIYFVILRYAFASVATALADFLVFYTLTASGTSILAANLLSRTVALWIQFTLLKKYVFKNGAGRWTFVAYVAYVFLMGYVSSAAQVQFARYYEGTPLLAKAAIESFMWIFNFMFMRDIVFRKRSDQ
jgi:glycosyltransferase involved in cell wall biosynthesis